MSSSPCSSLVRRLPETRAGATAAAPRHSRTLPSHRFPPAPAPGQLAYQFTAANVGMGPGEISYAVLVANGLSNAPTFSGMTADPAGVAWINAAGVPNSICFYSDDTNADALYYLIQGAAR
jgi:hypothetical protein